MKFSPTSMSPSKPSSTSTDEANTHINSHTVSFPTTHNPTSSTQPLKEFNRTHFQSLIQCVSRLFCDDEQIVLLDFLTHQEKSFTESDLIERLGWNTKRFREVCASLEREKYIVKEQISSSAVEMPYTPNKDRISYKQISKDKVLHTVGNTPYHYRINSHIAAVLQYRCRKVESTLENALDECYKEDIYSCVRCGRQFDALQAQTLDLHPEDAHFMCVCGNRLEHEDNAVDIERLTVLQKQCKVHLLPLRKEIEKVWGMYVPIFPPQNRYSEESKSTQNGRKGDKYTSYDGDSNVSNTTSNPSDAADGKSASTPSHPNNNFRVHIDPSEGQFTVKKDMPSWLVSGKQNATSPPPFQASGPLHLRSIKTNLPTSGPSQTSYLSGSITPELKAKNPIINTFPEPTTKAASYSQPDKTSQPSDNLNRVNSSEQQGRKHLQIKFKPTVHPNRDPRNYQKQNSSTQPINKTTLAPISKPPMGKQGIMPSPPTLEKTVVDESKVIQTPIQELIDKPTHTQPIKTTEEEEPSIFLSKFNRYFLLSECENLQQEMTHGEFEKFTELQDEFLNVF